MVAPESGNRIVEIPVEIRISAPSRLHIRQGRCRRVANQSTQGNEIGQGTGLHGVGSGQRRSEGFFPFNGIEILSVEPVPEDGE